MQECYFKIYKVQPNQLQGYLEIQKSVHRLDSLGFSIDLNKIRVILNNLYHLQILDSTANIFLKYLDNKLEIFTIRCRIHKIHNNNNSNLNNNNKSYQLAPLVLKIAKLIRTVLTMNKVVTILIRLGFNCRILKLNNKEQLVNKFKILNKLEEQIRISSNSNSRIILIKIHKMY